MARFDVYLGREGDYLLDCQANVLSDLNTRFCIPLQPLEMAPLAGRRLNPEFDIEGTALRMVTQFAASVPVRELGAQVANLSDQHSTIMNAIDMLTTGY
jgi:toxin CcdB